jgi:hypothetical protein
MAQITAGIKLKYAVETTAGTKPTSGLVAIPGISEIPEIGSSPETYETTTLDNLEFKTYIDGLKDTGGALGFTANDTPEFRTAVSTLISAQETALAGGKNVWFFIEVPDPIGETLSFTGKASPLGFGGASINGVLTTTLYVTATGEPTWNTTASE